MYILYVEDEEGKSYNSQAIVDNKGSHKVHLMYNLNVLYENIYTIIIKT